MVWIIRLGVILFFATTSFTLLSFQSIEIIHALINFIQDKHQLK